MSEPQTIRPKQPCDSSAARLVLAYSARAIGIKAAAKLFRTSRKTVRKWVSRYDQYGTIGLFDQVRAPRKQAHKIPPAVEEQVIELRRKNPTYGARRLIREFGLQLSHGAVDNILKAHGLIQPRKTKFSQEEEEVRMARLLDVIGTQGIPGDMEGDALSSPFSITNLAMELKRFMLANGSPECEQLDAKVRNAALVMHLCMLLERYQARMSADQHSEGTLQADKPPESAISPSDILDELRSTEFQEPESKETLQESGTRWNGPDDPKFKAFVEGLQSRLAYHSDLAKLFGVTRACGEISDGHLSGILADMVASTSKGRESVFNSVMRDVVADIFVANGVLPSPHYWRVLEFWSNLLAAGLGDVFQHRREQKENAYGLEIRELIVEEDRRGDLLNNLAKKAVSLPLFTGKLPRASGDVQSQEDAESQACEEIWKRLHPFLSSDPPAANPEFLKATITGALNKILLHARDHVWYQRDREREEAKILVLSDQTSDERTDGHPSGKKCLDDLIHYTDSPKGAQERLDAKLLVEQVLSRPELNERERKVLELVELQGYTQVETAVELGISQSSVSKLLASGKEKLHSLMP